ncbi:MAG: hypothetical protein ABIK07_13895 [Planctomycetota bacterium]|uniref:hypothetical protein n=1 Tax=uncultured Gimesia sp. TaxID=1678688 RepID=UPI0026379B81|nr:hypothetical protein [uncultured Gimesia sp.]
MARNEQDREDLMREATAFFPRAEFQADHESFPVFWGQKKSGQYSFYFGGDPVYQFDQSGCLRRAFIDGQLYRTQGDTLARLTRERNSDETVLKRDDLTITELDSLLQTMENRFQKLDSAFDKQDDVRLLHVLCDGSESELRALIQAQMKLVLQHSKQLAPRIRGKR